MLAAAGAGVGGLAPVGIAFPAVAVIATATRRRAGADARGRRARRGVADDHGAGRGHPARDHRRGVARDRRGDAGRRQPAAVPGPSRPGRTAAGRTGARRRRAGARRALAERNRIGREVHDVLAHSLGALSVQLEAADALLETRRRRRHEAREQSSRRAPRRRRADRARKAVHALRDEPVALAEQLTALAADRRCRPDRDRRRTPARRRCRTRALPRRAGGVEQRPQARARARRHAATGLRPRGHGPGRATTVPARTVARRARWPRPVVASDCGACASGSSCSAASCPPPRAGSGWTVRAAVPAMRVVVADDQTVVREGLVTLLSTMPGIEVVGSAGDGEQAVRLVAELAGRRADGPADARPRRHRSDPADPRRACPRYQVVVLTTYADDESIIQSRKRRIGSLTRATSSAKG